MGSERGKAAPGGASASRRSGLGSQEPWPRLSSRGALKGFPGALGDGELSGSWGSGQRAGGGARTVVLIAPREVAEALGNTRGARPPLPWAVLSPNVPGWSLRHLHHTLWSAAHRFVPTPPGHAHGVSNLCEKGRPPHGLPRAPGLETW